MDKKREFTAITVLKGILCLSILLHHTAAANAVKTGIMGWFAQYGGTACSFFFVISGFLLFYRYKPIESFGDWYALVKRRVLHLLPIHYVTLFFCIAVFLVTGRSLAGHSTGFWGTIPSLFLIQDWIPYHPEIRQCWDGVAWYISVLFFCYLVYPIIFNRARICFSVLIGAYYAVILVLIFHIFPIDEGNFIYHLPPARLLEFTLEGLTALALRSGKCDMLLFLVFPLAILGLILVPSCLTSTIGFALAPLFALILFAFLAVNWQEGFRRSMSMLFYSFIQLGKISFEVYMFHAILLTISITIVRKLFHSNSIILIIFLTLITTIFTSVLWRKFAPLIGIGSKNGIKKAS